MRMEIDRIIPKTVLEETFDFEKPNLDLNSVEDIRKIFEIEKTSDYSQFNSSIFVDIALKKLELIDPAKLDQSDA